MLKLSAMAEALEKISDYKESEEEEAEKVHRELIGML